MIQEEIVPSGSFVVVNRTRDKLLKAYLGSCVGVVLIDTQNQVGGLYHILLPEPPSKGAVQEPEKYASTGMPLFLEAMLAKGAKQENLQAYLAGGALVGRISLTDLKLDIGGQSAEIAANFLSTQNIPVVKMETGGYISTQIQLDTTNFSCEIEPIISMELDNAPHDFQEEYDLEEALNRIRPIPQIALKVIRMINSSQASLSHVAASIRKDQVLTAKVLQLINSAYFNPGREINSIDRALVFLGEKQVLLLTMSVFSELFFQQAEAGYSLVKGGLYRHALSVAAIAEQIATEYNTASPDIAFTAGLLHDIGKVALDQFMSRDYPLFYRRLQEQNFTSVVEVEKEVFGKDHTEMGEILAKRWELPATIREAIQFHHQPEKATINSALVHTVYLADWIYNSFNSHVTFGMQLNENFENRLKSLRMNKDHLLQLIDRIDWGKIEALYATSSSSF